MTRRVATVYALERLVVGLEGAGTFGTAVVVGCGLTGCHVRTGALDAYKLAYYRDRSIL